MRQLKITLLALAVSACATRPVPQNSLSAPPAAPATEELVVTETLHGVEISDPYRRLEDQDSSATRHWIARQNAYTDAVLDPRPEAALFSPRLTALMNTDKIGTPKYHNGRYFFVHRGIGEDLYSIYLRNGAHGKDELLVDPAPMSADHTTSVGIYDVSADAKVLAYSVRKGGADEIEVHFLDPETRQEIGAPLGIARYYGVSITDDRQLYFTRATPAGPRIYRRALAGGDETEVFRAGYGREKTLLAWVSEHVP